MPEAEECYGYFWGCNCPHCLSFDRWRSQADGHYEENNSEPAKRNTPFTESNSTERKTDTNS